MNNNNRKEVEQAISFLKARRLEVESLGYNGSTTQRNIIDRRGTGGLRSLSMMELRSISKLGDITLIDATRDELKVYVSFEGDNS